MTNKDFDVGDWVVPIESERRSMGTKPQKIVSIKEGDWVYFEYTKEGFGISKRCFELSDKGVHDRWLI